MTIEKIKPMQSPQELGAARMTNEQIKETIGKIKDAIDILGQNIDDPSKSNEELLNDIGAINEACESIKWSSPDTVELFRKGLNQAIGKLRKTRKISISNIH